MRSISLAGLSTALVLALTVGASAQGVGRLTTKSYQPIGKQKLQVDLTQVDAGELYRELRDHLKDSLARRGNPVGSSGTMGVKIEVSYPRPIQGPQLGATDRDSVYDRQGPTQGINSPIPQERTFAPRPTVPSGSSVEGERLNPLRVNVTVYREGGGAVAWTAEASCMVPFTAAKDVGRAMVDQIVARLDSSVSVAAQCGY